MNTLRCKPHSMRGSGAGFTLIEVLVALVVTAMGLLGLAKMQALAYASTGTAGLRSLVAIEAAGLASAMRANRAYWSLPIANASNSISISGTTVNSAGILNAAAMANGYCASGGGGAPCTPADLAANDLWSWADSLQKLVPNFNALTAITCPVTQPVACTITIKWTEKTVSINAQGANSQTNTGNGYQNQLLMQAPIYTLYVEP